MRNCECECEKKENKTCSQEKLRAEERNELNELMGFNLMPKIQYGEAVTLEEKKMLVDS